MATKWQNCSRWERMESLQTWQRVESLSPFRKKKTAQGNFSSSVTFPVFSMLIIILVLLTFTLTLLTPMIIFKILEVLPITQAFQQLMPIHQHIAVVLEILILFIKIVLPAKDLIRKKVRLIPNVILPGVRHHLSNTTLTL